MEYRHRGFLLFVPVGQLQNMSRRGIVEENAALSGRERLQKWRGGME